MITLVSYIKFLYRKNIYILKKFEKSDVKCKIRWYKYIKLNNDIDLLVVYFKNLKKIYSNINNKSIKIFFILNNLINTFILLIYYFILYYYIFGNFILVENIENEKLIYCYSNIDLSCELENFNIGNEPEYIYKEDKLFSILKNKIKCEKKQNLNIYIQYCSFDSKDFNNEFAKKSLLIKNGGGSSNISEAYSIELLMYELNAYDCIFEKKVEYKITCKMVDYILFIPDLNEDIIRIGVSTTRSFLGINREFTYEDGERLIKNKIKGLVFAKTNVSPKHTFFTSILHIFVQNEKIKDIILEVFEKIDLDEFYITYDFNVWITITEFEAIYTNKFL